MEYEILVKTKGFYMAHSCRRYDISDAVCSLLELHLPKRLRRISQRKSSVHIHVVFLIMRTGHRGRIYYRIMVIGAMRTAVLFARVCGKDLLETLIDDSDYERIMIDVSHGKAHSHAAGATGGNQDMSRTKEGSTAKYIWQWVRIICWLIAVMTAMRLLSRQGSRTWKP